MVEAFKGRHQSSEAVRAVVRSSAVSMAALELACRCDALIGSPHTFLFLDDVKLLGFALASQLGIMSKTQPENRISVGKISNTANIRDSILDRR